MGIEGLSGLVFHDSVTKVKGQKETRPRVTFSSEVDRVYTQVPKRVNVFLDKKKEKESLCVTICNGGEVQEEKEGFSDIVVWNPWIEKSKKMTDFDDDEVNLFFYF